MSGKNHSNQRYRRFLLMLIPVVPAAFIMFIPGFQFSAAMCVAVSLLIGLFCLLSLYRSKTAAVLKVLLTVLVLSGLTLLGFTEAKIIDGSRPDSAPCDYVIVLGAGVNGTEPSLTLQERINTACDYLTSHPNVTCVVSGGQGSDENITEAECMRRELVRLGIPSDRILKEDRATDTEENIRYSLDLIEHLTGRRPETAGIISSEFHLYRAKQMAARQGLTAVGIPAKTDWMLLRVNYYLREAAAVWYHTLFGGM